MTINDIITLGENGIIGDKEFSKKLLYSLPINPKVKALSFIDLENLMKGLLAIENTKEGYGAFGSTTVMGKLLKLLKLKDIENKESRVNSLINWMLDNRNNPYIPFGVHVPLEVKSVKGYALHESAKYKRREERETENKRRSEQAKAKKTKKVTEHKERQNTNLKKRDDVIKKTKKLNIVNKFKWIVESEYPINIYPEEYAEISSDELEKIPKDLLEKILLKLKYAKKGSQWKVLKNVISDYLKLDQQIDSLIPNYIICPDCGNILNISFKTLSCPNPLCSFRFKGLDKYLNKNIAELIKELGVEYRGKDEHLIKLISTALKYNSGANLADLIKNFDDKEYRKKYETFILLHLKDVNLVKNVLVSDAIKDRENIYVSKNGYKIFPELIEFLYSVHDVKIRDFLMKEFANYHVKSFRTLMNKRKTINK